MEGEGRGIALRVVEEDALLADVDVLVLKHAQDMYGLDRKAVQRIRMDPKLLPPIDGYRPWPGSDMGAETVIFVGVPTLRSFGYLEIRQFARKALSAVASEAPTTRVLGMTLHGAGYGLDEVEAFQAELAGLLDAMAAGDVPRSLEQIRFLEINPGRARRMAEVLADLMPQPTVRPGQSIEQVVARDPARRLRDVGHEPQKRHAFVAMPFAEAFDDTFRYGIANSVREAGLLCERIDQQAFTGDVMERMKDLIENAAFVVADLTDAKPNVFLEVGYAWGIGVPTILLCKEGQRLQFDVQGQKCLFYKSIHDLEEKLTAELKALST